MALNVVGTYAGIHLSLAERGPGKVFVITMQRGQNRFNPHLVKGMHQALDAVEAAEHPKALVITGQGKFFSNGLDLDFNKGGGGNFLGQVLQPTWRLLARILVLGCHTVAAINGHGFGAGFFLALACDYRVMNSKRGFLNFPEAQLGMKLSRPFAEMIRAKLPPSSYNAAVLQGRRLGAQQAVALGAVDREAAPDKLLTEATEWAFTLTPLALKQMGFNQENFSTMKSELYVDAFTILSKAVDEPPASKL